MGAAEVVAAAVALVVKEWLLYCCSISFKYTLLLGYGGNMGYGGGGGGSSGGYGDRDGGHGYGGGGGPQYGGGGGGGYGDGYGGGGPQFRGGGMGGGRAGAQRPRYSGVLGGQPLSGSGGPPGPALPSVQREDPSAIVPIPNEGEHIWNTRFTCTRVNDAADERAQRPKLNLLPRTKPRDSEEDQLANNMQRAKIFGEAKPVGAHPAATGSGQ